MSKNSNMENITRLYEIIRTCFDAEGYSLEEVMSLDSKEREDVVDYEAIDAHFDKIISRDSFTKKLYSCGMLQRLSLLSFSKVIAEYYLRDSKEEICDIGSTEEERALEAIYAYAKRRDFVEGLSHYVDKGQALVNMILQRLNCYANVLQEKLRSTASAIKEPTFKSEAFRGINDRVAILRKKLELYPKKHQDYIGKCVQ